MPPSAFGSSVYCASPAFSSATSFVSSGRSAASRALAVHDELAHVADVEQADRGADGGVLGRDAGVPHRHVPAAERGHPRAERDVLGMERGALHGMGSWG